MTTDSFVVKPLRFPGGSIGELAVNGTVNDLAMAGARPLALTVSMILEEGLDAAVLEAEVEAIARAATAAGVEIVGGDTKVVERGAADRMYLCTTGHRRRRPARAARTDGIAPGDQVLVSGPIGEHGTAIMLARNQFDLDAELESDTRLAVAGRRCAARRRRRRTALPARRDARRRRLGAQRAGPGLAASRSSSTRPTCRFRRSCAAAAELLGIDPMYVANEGRLVAFVAPEARRRGARGAAARAGVRGGGGDRRGAGGAAGDGAGGDGFWRQAGDGSAGR